MSGNAFCGMNGSVSKCPCEMRAGEGKDYCWDTGDPSCSKVTAWKVRSPPALHRAVSDDGFACRHPYVSEALMTEKHGAQRFLHSLLQPASTGLRCALSQAKSLKYGGYRNTASPLTFHHRNRPWLALLVAPADPRPALVTKPA